MTEKNAIKSAVREYYAQRVRDTDARGAAVGDCCTAAEGGGEASPCCRPGPLTAAGDPIAAIPTFGCGTPLEPATFRSGDVVVDLGSGPGHDAFLAARAVGPTGRVIGIDMTSEMIDRARGHARRMGFSNVEFQLGDIEALPLANECADLVISNCVLTLVPDKRRALAEAARVLRPGGRFVVNDIVASTPLPAALRDDLQAWSACVSGAITQEEYKSLLRGVGFVGISITHNGDGIGTIPTFSARIIAQKPASR